MKVINVNKSSYPKKLKDNKCTSENLFMSTNDI